jgi:small acid-soluble spore protein D (minor alpha/beta-type SASP)
MVKGNKILVPEAQLALNQLKAKIVNSPSPDNAKFEVANELGIPFNERYNGELTSHQAGKVGGRLGGSMVKELVKLAQESLKNNGPH